MIKAKSLPFGGLPYKEDAHITRMLIKLFEKTLYLPFFPLISHDDNVLMRTLSKVPGISYEKKKIILNIVSPFFPKDAELMESVYNNPTEENLEKYSIESPFGEQFFTMIARTCPNEAILHLQGAFSLAETITNIEENHMLADKFYRKFFVQILIIKALWFIKKIKKLSPKTTPIIIFEEPKLNIFSIISKDNENINRETLIKMFSIIIRTLKSEGALVGIQCFNKCDWSIPIDAGADIISFDAYNNPANLNVIPDKIKEFLERGGIINWGIVPVMTETIVKDLTVDYLYTRLTKTIQGLVDCGIKRKLIYSNSTVSIQGECYKLSPIFAEKALILSKKLGDKVFKD